LKTWKGTLSAHWLQSILPWLQHSWTWTVRSVGVSGQRESSFSIFRNPIISTSTKMYIFNVSFSSVNYCVIYTYYFRGGFRRKHPV
jgi:hypothetical protein